MLYYFIGSFCHFSKYEMWIKIPYDILLSYLDAFTSKMAE